MRRFGFCIAALVCLLLCSVARLQAQAPNAEPLRTPADRPVDILHIRLDLRVDLEKQEVEGQATIHLKALRKIRHVSFDAVDHEVASVRGVQGKDTRFQPQFSNDGKRLTIDLPEPWQEGTEGSFTIEYRIRQPKAGLHFFKPSPAEPDVPHTVWSQGEPIANRHWFPCADHPNEKQTTELVVTVPQGFEALSNGRLVGKKDDAAGKLTTFHWKQEQPHVAYLVTLVVGKYAVVEEEWRGKPVLYYVPRSRQADVARTFGRTREMLDFFSRRFGVDYPWEKYAQVVVEQFTWGGMENTSATTLNDRSLHDQRAMLDSSPDDLIAHELAHQWWGDLITCKDWSHLWLNEGFASYAEVLWAEHKEGADEAAIDLLAKARSAMEGGKTRPVVDRRYLDPIAMFDARSYPKGAWVLHMLRKQLGEEAFWRCIRRYATEHRHASVDTTDFRKTLERETGRSLERFFHDWTERPGHPIVEVTTEFLPESKLARVTVKQTQAGEAFHLPLHMEFHCPLSSPIVLQEEITEKEQRFFVPLSSRPSLVRLDADQSVLAEWKEHKGRELWVAQLTTAPNAIERIRAARHLGSSKQPADREELAKALAAEKFHGVASEIAIALGESGGETARDALLAGLQSSHPRVRRTCAQQLGKFKGDARAAAALKTVFQKGDASYFVEADAAEAYARLGQEDTVSALLPLLARPSHNEVIRSAAVAGLGSSQDPDALDPLIEWTRRGKPRQCRAAALRGLERLAATGKLPVESRNKAIQTITACLEGEGPIIRRAAAEALRGLGSSASPALPALEALSQHDADDRVRELAGKAVEQIRTNSPAPVELNRLREELNRLKRANEQLQERLEKFERADKR